MKALLLVAFALAALSLSLIAQHPVVPGVQRLRPAEGPTPVEGATPAERGAILLGELSCTACHTAPQSPLGSRPAPRLDAIGARVTSGWLRDYLRSPRANKPGTLMPDCLTTSRGEEREAVVDDLVHYLVTRGGPLRPATVSAQRDLVGKGRELFDTVGCAACHAPSDGRETEVGSIPLGKLAHKTTVDALRKFLRDPHATRRSGRMPKLWLSDDETLQLAMYLLRDQIDNPQADDVVPPSDPGLFFDYFELETNELPRFDLLGSVKRGTEPHVRLPRAARKKNFALRFRGELKVPDDGAYTFELRANDGARLLVDGYVVVDDDRKPGKSRYWGTAELLKGKHAIEIQYFQSGDGRELSLQWQGPGFGNRRVPDDAFSNRFGRAMVPLESPAEGDKTGKDAKKVKRGRTLFLSQGCAACHEPGAKAPRGKPLSEVDVDGERSCVGDRPAVDFALSDVQKSELRAALSGGAWQKKPDAGSSVRRAFAALNCYACHLREGIGGPETSRYALFKTKISIDLGDEGKVPPPLTAVGEKLRPAVLRSLLSDDVHRIRGRFMKTRMPGFHADALESLVDDLLVADVTTETGARATRGPVDAKLVQAGRRLVGTTGFACVTCHNVNGDRSAGISGIDLATSQNRLTRQWFHKFLRKPMAFRADTRMPGFWGSGEESPIKDLLGGSTTKQIDAVWTYLSLGKSIPAPEGVQRPDGGPKMELLPRTEPIVHRTFMTGVGGRAILAGFPEKLHVAFDAHAVRLAKVWRGRFFDASGVASGRSGKFLGPLGDEVLDLPAPAFAQLATAKAAWPVIEKNERDVGGTFRGLRLDPKRRPIFRYDLAGVGVEEQPLPRHQIGGASLRRLFTLTPRGKAPVDLHFRAWTADKIEKVADGTWRAGKATITLKTDARDPVRIRAVDGKQELLVQFVFRGGAIRFEQEIRW